MRLHKGVKVAGIALVGLALVATGACGKKKSSGPGTGPVNLAKAQADNVAGEAAQKLGKKGGTLRIVGQGDLSNFDTGTSYEVIGWGYVMRPMVRELLTYPNVADPAKRDAVVPDVASALPEISADGLTYTFVLKDNVKWAPPISRTVVAGDFVRGIKRLCDPNNPSGGLTYFQGTISGMDTFCGTAPDESGKGGTGFAAVKPGDAAAAKAYVEGHQISGLTAPEADKLVFKLKARAGDFVNILATSFAAAVPVENLAFIADSPEYRQHFPANGPYMLDSYKADEHIWMKRNPNWVAASDTVRKAFVDRIEITTNAANDVTQQQQIEGGAQDLYFGGEPPVEAINRLAPRATPKDPRIHIQVGDGCISYMVFNFHRNTPGGKALQNVKVRQAINFATDKISFRKVVGGPAYGVPTGQILTSPILGYKKYDPFKTTGDTGDVTKAKALLTEAGYPSGLTLTFIYRPKRKGEEVFIALRDSLKKAGIILQPKKVPDADYYGKHISDPAVNDWDLTAPAWCPDWNGNGARTFFLPLLDGRSVQKGTTNYGGYNNADVNAKVDTVLAESDTTKVLDGWAAIDKQVTDEAAWVPLLERNAIVMLSARIQGYVFFPFSAGPDVTNIWIK